VPQLLVLEDRTVLSVLTVLNNADSGDGSLRAAIAAAQSGDKIVFDPSLAYETITLSSGPLALSSNLTINGLGANQLTISGNQHSRLFTLSGSAQVALANLTLTAGMSSKGGAILIGGTAALTLDSDILSGNQAVGDVSGYTQGGAVFNSAGASLTINNTRFVNNLTDSGFTGDTLPTAVGGAIANDGTLAITGATFIGNAALEGITYVTAPFASSMGGAIANLDGSTATISLTTFTANQALASVHSPGSNDGDAAGGAICNGLGATCTMSQCTFANNTAQAGPGIHRGGGAAGGAIANNLFVNLTVLSCSFTGNQANSGGGESANGGAIDDSLGDTVTISGSQFISNRAIANPGGAFAFAGAVDNFHTMTIDNCLFTGNSAVGGPMADGDLTFGQASGGAILTGADPFYSGVSNVVVLTISNSILAGNEAIGGSGGSTLGGNFSIDLAAGGGILNSGILNNNGGTLNVAGCTITGNQAIGGASAQGSGGDAFGGGILNDMQGTLNLTNSTVSANLSQGGPGASGAAGGVASGAGIDNERSSIAIVTNSIISLNESVGGPGSAGANGGDGVGGGVSNAVYAFAYGITDASSLVVSNCQIIGNVAQGGTEGSGAVGGDGLGGGIFVGSGTATLKGVLVSGNQAQGGVDSQQNTTGQGLGGGVYVDPSATATMDMQTVIAGNQASKSDNDVWGTITIIP
jgi:hypothetical protein